MMMKEVLNALSNNSFINKYELDDEKSLAWVETTKMCKDGFPYEVLIDFDGNQDVVTVAHIFRISLADNFFSKCSTISLFMANQLNSWLVETGYPGCFSLSFGFGKESAFAGNLTYCSNIHKGVDLPTMIRTMSCSIKALIEIVDNIETFIEKTRRTPELLEVDDAIFIDKINEPEKISDSELFEKTMIFALHPAFEDFLSSIDEKDSESES